MKTDKIRINKNAENPEGVEVEIVQPETELEERVLSFALAGTLRELKRANLIQYDLPEQFKVEHRKDGTFLASAFPESGYYEPARPIAVLGLRNIGNRFDLIHAPVPARPAAQQQAAQPAAAPAETPAAQ